MKNETRRNHVAEVVHTIALVRIQISVYRSVIVAANSRWETSLRREAVSNDTSRFFRRIRVMNVTRGNNAGIDPGNDRPRRHTQSATNEIDERNTLPRKLGCEARW